MAFGMVVIGIIFYFIVFGTTLTLENIILRISALIVPSYFAVLFVNQFFTQKSLYEVYKFKDVALQTMIALRTQFGDDYEGRRELLERSLSVIFSEPSIKDDSKQQKQMITELIRLLSQKAS